jgi:glycine betaine/proline transport system ATP-binding protein
VQIGTPEEILTDPANDYVAQFVQDVDRARVLTASSVMEHAKAVIPLSAGPRAALRIMRDLQTSAVFVTRRDRTLAGVVRDRDVLRQVKSNQNDLEAILRHEATVVPTDAHLVDLVEPSVGSDLPIAVVGDDGRLLGVIPRVTLLAALGNMSTSTGDIPVQLPPTTLTLEVIAETLRESTTEGAVR